MICTEDYEWQSKGKSLNEQCIESSNKVQRYIFSGFSQDVTVLFQETVILDQNSEHLNQFIGNIFFHLLFNYNCCLKEHGRTLKRLNCETLELAFKNYAEDRKLITIFTNKRRSRSKHWICHFRERQTFHLCLSYLT